MPLTGGLVEYMSSGLRSSRHSGPSGRRLSRRAVLSAVGATGLSSLSYGSAIEPLLRLKIARYRASTRRWPAGLSLSIAVLADFHIHEPFMSLAHLERIVTVTNDLRADLIVILGDYLGGPRLINRGLPIPTEQWAAMFARLRAPLGVWSVLGNHDWWSFLPTVRAGLTQARIPILENGGVPLRHKGYSFWLLGLGDQQAIPLGNKKYLGVDDLPSTLASIRDGSPAILLAHEPLIFPEVPPRVDLTLAAHTHGGQIWLPGLGYFGILDEKLRRYAYGQYDSGGCRMIVCAGLGMSIIPVRFLVPPEIALVTLEGTAAA